MFHFGHGFENHYHIPYVSAAFVPSYYCSTANRYGHGLNRLQDVYARGADSFAKTIVPSEQNLRLIRLSREELASQLLPTASGPTTQPRTEFSSPNPSPYIGVHVRRGDRLGDTWWYHNENLPIYLHIKAVRSAWPRLYPDTPIPNSDSDTDVQVASSFPAPPFTYLASDSPDALQDFASAFSPETGIFSLQSSKHEELRALVPKRAYVQKEFVEELPEERIRLTRGMVVDLAMVSGFWAQDGEVIPSATVCGIS